MNLIGNAIKHHGDPDNAVVRVAAVVREDCYELSISDNGPGIDPQFQDQIFEAFRTLQPKDVVDSTGIGLSIVKKIIEGEGGRVTVSSQLGSGSTFRVMFPVREVNCSKSALEAQTPA